MFPSMPKLSDFVRVKFTVQSSGEKFTELWSYFLPASQMRGTLHRLRGIPEHDIIFVKDGKILTHDFKFQRDQDDTNQGCEMLIVFESEAITLVATYGDEIIEVPNVAISSSISEVKTKVAKSFGVVQDPKYLALKSEKRNNEYLDAEEYSLTMYGLVEDKQRVELQLKIKIKLQVGNPGAVDVIVNPNQTVGNFVMDLYLLHDIPREMKLSVNGVDLADENALLSDFVGHNTVVNVRFPIRVGYGYHIG